jgi:hypothetical protein
LYALVYVVVAFFAAVLIHELGHALACLTLGFRITELAVWPFCFRRNDGEWLLVGTSRLARSRLGWVGFYPVSGDRLRTRSLLCAAVGPFASLIVGTAGALSAGYVEKLSSGAALFLGATALWSLCFGVFSLIPSSKAGTSSDGLRLFDLVRGKPGIIQLYAIESLICCDWLRPREWDDRLVQIALGRPAGVGLPLEVDMAVHWVRYQWCADSGDVEKAAKSLQWILQQDLSATDRLTWAWEAVWFQAFSRKDAAEARAMQGVAQGHTPVVLTAIESIQIWKSKAGVAACEGRVDDAREAALNAVSLAKSERSYAAGLTKALEDDLAGLIRGMGNVTRLSGASEKHMRKL